MNTPRHLLVAAGALLGTALILSAAPDSRYNHTAPAPAKLFTNDRGPAREVKTPAPAAATTTATPSAPAASCAACACCTKST